MESCVALVQTRPETVLEDHARLLRLAGLLPLAADNDELPDLLVAPAKAGPSPAGEATPWQLMGVARALVPAGHPGPGPGISWPGHGAAPWAPSVLSALGLSGSTGPAGSQRWLLSGLTLHRRLRAEGPLAAALAHLAPAQRPVALARRPERLQAALRELAPHRPDAVVLDLTVCADGPEPLALHLLLAGRDLVAVEATACRLLALAPSSAPLLRAAERAGWGTSDTARITVMGDHDGRPVATCRMAQHGAGGWLADDLPAWIRYLSHRWRRWSPMGRGPKRRYDTLAWGRLWRDPGALVRAAGGNS